jgi:protein tyrosine phosphatase (PTP) superfamily phosphohydrolase (DUF442 family)
MQKVISMKQLFRLFLGLTVVFSPVGASAETLTVGLMELVNYYEYSPQLLTSGQPARDQFPAIKAADVDAIINLAPVTDPTALADEGEIVRALGLAYTHIPVDWENPTREDYARFLSAMRESAGKRVLVHCYAGSRASAFVYLYRVQEQGESSQAARKIMIDLWDYSPGYEFYRMRQWRDFVARIESGPSLR